VTLNFVGKDPTLSRAVDTTWFYGYTPDLRRVAAEPGHLACMRLQAAGTSTIVAAPTSGIRAHLAGLQKVPEAKIGLGAIISFVTGLTQESLNAAQAAGAGVVHAVVPANSMVMVPLGFVTAVKTANNANVYGIRQSFVFSSPTVKRNLTAVKECLIENGTPTSTSVAEQMATILQNIAA
jgi:hypothetical protein